MADRQQSQIANLVVNKLLGIAVTVEIVVGVAWTLLAISLVSTSLAIVGVFFWVYALFSAIMLFAAWCIVRRPANRKMAAIALFMPAVFTVVPIVLRQLTGEPLITESAHWLILAMLGLLAMIGFCVVFPARAALWVPGWLFRSRAVSILILVGVILAGLTAVVALGVTVYVVSGQADLQGDKQGYALLYSLLFVLVTLLVVFAASVFASVFGYLGLHSKADVQHRLHTVLSFSIVPGTLALTLFAGIYSAMT